MQLIINFSGRKDGNCDAIAAYIARQDDRIAYMRDQDIHACSGCAYECFFGLCRYRHDDAFDLFRQMAATDRIIFIVPMYCGNPSSLYFKLCERSQDYFMACGDEYPAFAEKLYIIGVFGSQQETPDFLRVFESWFEAGEGASHILGLERHLYGQKMQDCLLDDERIRARIDEFINRTTS